jgi:hypothetical protein
MDSTWTVGVLTPSRSTSGFGLISALVGSLLLFKVRALALHRVSLYLSATWPTGRGTRETSPTLALLHISNRSRIYRKERHRFCSRETVEDRLSSDADLACHVARKRLCVLTSCLIVYTIRSRISDRYIHDSQIVVQQPLRVERFVAYETESLSGTFGVCRRLLHDWGRVRIHQCCARTEPTVELLRDQVFSGHQQVGDQAEQQTHRSEP